MAADDSAAAAGERVAHLSSPSFDASVPETWCPLLNGGTVVVIDRDTVLSPAALAEMLKTGGMTRMYPTTALFNQVARLAPDAFGEAMVSFGGEAGDAAVVRELRAAGCRARLLHCYGPSETTAFCIYLDVVSVPADATAIPIGRPMTGVHAWVVDRRLRPVPAGAPGELCVGGTGVAHGYLNNPALTAERFVPDPFSPVPGARMYRSGDRARWITPPKTVDASDTEAADSAAKPRTFAPSHSRTAVLEFLGRFDAQVKVRGYRIEPGEIESVLHSIPGVAHAAVAPRPDAAGGVRLVAWMVPSGELDLAAVRAELGRRLPAWMVPAILVPVDHIPLNANGKVDRAALTDPDGAAAEVEHVEPETETEVALAALWREVLKAERVGALDSFFALGGHSLLAMTLASRLRVTFEVEMELRDLFAHATLREMAAHVDALREDELERLLREIDGMTDDEARAQLAETGDEG